MWRRRLITNKKKSLLQLIKPNPLRTSIAFALGLALPVLVSPAFAQDDELEEITVTGSRIVRRDYDASSPIVTINAESFN